MQASSCADHGRFTETRVGLSSRSPTTQRLSTNTTLPSFAERNHVSLPQRSFQTIVTTTKCPDTSRNGKRDGHLRVHTQRIYAKDGDDCVSLGGLWKQIHIRKAETAETATERSTGRPVSTMVHSRGEQVCSNGFGVRLRHNSIKGPSQLSIANTPMSSPILFIPSMRVY